MRQVLEEHNVEGFKSLAINVLFRALRDVVGAVEESTLSRAERNKIQYDALQWFLNEKLSLDYLSFPLLCEVLELDRRALLYLVLVDKEKLRANLKAILNSKGTSLWLKLKID